MTNCPNCGAPIVADQCEYCGTVFHKPEKIELLEAKTKYLEQQITINQLYMAAIEAMRSYGKYY